jgi:hypothetical protein
MTINVQRDICEFSKTDYLFNHKYYILYRVFYINHVAGTTAGKIHFETNTVVIIHFMPGSGALPRSRYKWNMIALAGFVILIFTTSEAMFSDGTTLE